MKYTHTPDMGGITFFGGEYEACCQRMLNAGVQWVLKNQHKNPEYRDYEVIRGICISNNQDAQALDRALVSGSKKDLPAGCMHQGVVDRVLYIKQHGWEVYCKEMRKKYKERVCAR